MYIEESIQVGGWSFWQHLFLTAFSTLQLDGQEREDNLPEYDEYILEHIYCFLTWTFILYLQDLQDEI